MADAEPDHTMDDYDPARHPAQLIRRVHQRAVQLFSQSANDPSLSSPQFVSLVTLLKHGPMTLAELGRAISMDPSTTTLVVRKLERDKLIVRRRSEEDRRMFFVELTEGGRLCAEDHIPASLASADHLLSPLTTVEKTIFLELMRKILAGDAVRD